MGVANLGDLFWILRIVSDFALTSFGKGCPALRETQPAMNPRRVTWSAATVQTSGFSGEGFPFKPGPVGTGVGQTRHWGEGLRSACSHGFRPGPAGPVEPRWASCRTLALCALFAFTSWLVFAESPLWN